MSQDVPRDQGLVDARVLVGVNMHKSLSRDTLISRIALRQNQSVVEVKKRDGLFKEDRGSCRWIAYFFGPFNLLVGCRVPCWKDLGRWTGTARGMTGKSRRNPVGSQHLTYAFCHWPFSSEKFRPAKVFEALSDVENWLIVGKNWAAVWFRASPIFHQTSHKK